MSRSFDLEAPDHFTVGAVGPPGQRIFYLQGRESGTLVTLKCEKEQVAALGEYLVRLLDRRPAAGAERPPRDRALLEPVDAAWAAGAIGVGYDEDGDRIIVQANEQVEEESEAEPATARFRLTRAQATAFVEQARDLLKASRPLCPVCSRPIDADGHLCPRSNGHAVR